MPVQQQPPEFEIGQRVTTDRNRQGTVVGIDGEHIYLRLRASQHVIKVTDKQLHTGWEEGR